MKRTRPWGIQMITFAILLLVLYVWVRVFEWSNLYHPRRVLEATPEAVGLKFEDVKFVAEDGVLLQGWWIPAQPARGTVIHCYGNGENIGNLPWLAAELHRHHVNVFLFDYRGYGRSRGFPTEQGTYRDARAAFEFVRAQYDNAEQPPVIAYGRSLGGAVAIQLALDKPLRGLIVESSFTSTLDMAAVLFPKLPARWFCRYRYDSLSKIPRIAVPKLLVHGTADRTVPFAMGEALFRAAPGPKTFLRLSSEHNDPCLEMFPQYRAALEQFLTETLGPAPEEKKPEPRGTPGPPSES